MFAAAEGTCPFCAVALPADLASRAAAGVGPGARLSRSETFNYNRVARGHRALRDDQLSAAAGGVRLGELGPQLGSDALSSSGDNGSSFAMYGAPGGAWTSPTPGDDGGSSFAMYGAPGDDAWTSPTPGDDGGSSFAMYGAPGEWTDPGGSTWNPDEMTTTPAFPDQFPMPDGDTSTPNESPTSDEQQQMNDMFRSSDETGPAGATSDNEPFGDQGGGVSSSGFAGDDGGGGDSFEA